MLRVRGSTLKMEEIRSSEALVTAYKNTGSHNPDDYMQYCQFSLRTKVCLHKTHRA
jgi:hypothetical protein